MCWGETALDVSGMELEYMPLCDLNLLDEQGTEQQDG